MWKSIALRVVYCFLLLFFGLWLNSCRQRIRLAATSHRFTVVWLDNSGITCRTRANEVLVLKGLIKFGDPTTGTTRWIGGNFQVTENPDNASAPVKNSSPPACRFSVTWIDPVGRAHSAVSNEVSCDQGIVQFTDPVTGLVTLVSGPFQVAQNADPSAKTNNANALPCRFNISWIDAYGQHHSARSNDVVCDDGIVLFDDEDSGASIWVKGAVEVVENQYK